MANNCLNLPTKKGVSSDWPILLSCISWRRSLDNTKGVIDIFGIAHLSVCLSVRRQIRLRCTQRRSKIRKCISSSFVGASSEKQIYHCCLEERRKNNSSSLVTDAKLWQQILSSLSLSRWSDDAYLCNCLSSWSCWTRRDRQQSMTCSFRSYHCTTLLLQEWLIFSRDSRTLHAKEHWCNIFWGVGISSHWWVSLTGTCSLVIVVPA